MRVGRSDVLPRNEALAPLTRHVVVEAPLSAQHVTVECAASLIPLEVCGDCVVVGAEQCDSGAQEADGGGSPAALPPQERRPRGLLRRSRRRPAPQCAGRPPALPPPPGPSHPLPDPAVRDRIAAL
ncbi:MAG: hypothetical protein AMXMBFR64_50970 [Myxococcales bacterium]